MGPLWNFARRYGDLTEMLPVRSRTTLEHHAPHVCTIHFKKLSRIHKVPQTLIYGTGGHEYHCSPGTIHITIEIAFSRSCPYIWFPLAYCILVGGVCVYHRNRVLWRLFFLKKNHPDDELERIGTPLQTPLFTKYWSFDIRTGAIHHNARFIASVLGHFPALDQTAQEFF